MANDKKPDSRKKAKRNTRAGNAKKSTVQKLPPDAPEAHDEGPRLIPFAGPSFSRANMQEPSLPTDGYVALADHAMSMWEKADEPKKRKK
jgi:hypothetical protein